MHPAPDLTLDVTMAADIRRQWLRLMEITVFGELKTDNPAAITRVRKRTLDLGEKFRSLLNDRSWIPQPRERLKNALASALNVREALSALEQAAQAITGGGDNDEFRSLLVALRRTVVEPLRDRENTWAAALETLNRDTSED